MGNANSESLICGLNEGNPDAVERMFVAYEPYLRMVVRRRMSQQLRSKIDSKDIVQSVFAHLIVGFRNGAWQFTSPFQLRAFLRRVAWRRLADRYQHFRNDLGRVQSLNQTTAAEHPKSPAPRPSEAAQGVELWERILQSCPPQHQEIVRLRIKGLRLTEIARATNLHEGSVRRILYSLAREMSVTRRPIDRDPEPLS